MKPYVRIVAITLALALSGCATTKTPVALSTGPDVARDRSNGRAILLTRLDFPRGWKALPKTKGGRDMAVPPTFGACVGSAIGTYKVEVDGTDFTNGPAQVGSSISFAPTPAQAARDLAQFGNALKKRCFSTLMRTMIETGVRKGAPTAHVSSLTVKRLALGKVGDASAGYRMTTNISAQGHRLTVFLDLVLIRAKRAEITMEFSSVGAAFDAALQRRLIRNLGRRLDLA